LPSWAVAPRWIRMVSENVAKERFSYPLRPELARSGT
jgi:hypothetical protein